MRCPFAQITDERARCMGGCWSSGGRAHSHWDTHESARTIQRALYCPLLDVGQLDASSGASWVWSCPEKCLVLRARKTLFQCDGSLRGAGLYRQRHACSRPVGVRPALRHGSTAVKIQGTASAGQGACHATIAKFDITASQPATILITAHHRHCQRWTTRANGLDQRRDELDESGAAGQHRRQYRHCRQTAKPSSRGPERARGTVAAQPPLVAARRRSPPLVAARRGSPPLVAARRRCRPAPYCQVNSSRKSRSTPLDTAFATRRHSSPSSPPQ
jgi:hypothetical protein